jgi:hypothetical protein
MQAPKGVRIGEFNDTLARPRSYLYNLYANATVPLLQPHLTTPSCHSSISILSSPPPHAPC